MSDRQTSRVVIAEPFSESGLRIFRADGVQVADCAAQTRERLLKELADADGLIVRSQTRVDANIIEAAPRLRVIARAGVGVDSIDVASATRAGIVVLNTPTANVLAAVEQTFALMLAFFRNTVQANVSLKAGLWERQALVGRELHGKKLGVAGLGRIGAAVAARALTFGMQVAVYDPYITSSVAEAHRVQLLSLEELLQQSDVITLHLPLNDETERLIDAARLKMLKPDALLVNCARGGLIDEEALLAALDEGCLTGAALDVFAEEPAPPGSTSARLQTHPRVLATPHLGGSTHEAFERVAIELARDVVNVLRGRPAYGAVNAPIPHGADAEKLRPYVELAYRIGVLCPQLIAPAELRPLSVTLCGEISNLDAAPLVTALLSGLLQGTTDRRISIVNADAVAQERGIAVAVHRRSADEWLASLEITAGSLKVVGTSLHGPRIVQIDDFEIDAVPAGTLIVTRHRDIPGMVGRVGTVLGEDGVNISSMQVARSAKEEGPAMMVLSVDRPPNSSTMRSLERIAGMLSVRSVHL